MIIPSNCISNGSRSSKTFKPKKNIPEGSHQYELLKHAEATLGSGNLRMAVMLPEGEDLNEWVAVNTVDFFNQINMLYGTITDFCTEQSCALMSAGPKYEYHWADGTNIKKPIKCSAPKYIDYLMTWVQDQLDDETLFPSKIGVPFPKNFMSVAKTILKRLFRVYAHIYHQHFDTVIQLQEEAHLNTSFKHFIFFVQTFKPKKNIPEGSHQYELLKHAEATLGSGNLRMAVMLPEGEDLNEWVAVNTVDFFNQINMLYGTITDFCTEQSCALMSAGPKYEYHWADGTNIKKPIKCSAPKYIDYLMTWVQDQLDDETLFPSKIGVPFPKNFMSVAKTILKRLFRVYAHIYHQHFDTVIQLQEEAHLNTSFKHFIFFVQEFNLIDRKELVPLQELIDKFTTKDR
ncbi:UNVERIFIED_CONTAM: hypothetical protein FKN15_073340 [Acipenser sinensis]